MNLISLILSLPKSLYVNFRLMPLREALHLPVLIKYNTVVKQLGGVKL